MLRTPSVTRTGTSTSYAAFGPDSGDQIEIAHHFPPFHDHVEEALASRSPVGLGKLEGYHIVAVGQGDGVGKVAKAHVLVEDIVGGVSNGHRAGRGAAATLNSLSAS